MFESGGREGSTSLAMYLIFNELFHSLNIGTIKNTNKNLHARRQAGAPPQGARQGRKALAQQLAEEEILANRTRSSPFELRSRPDRKGCSPSA